MKKIKILILCLFAIFVSGCDNIKPAIDGVKFYEIATSYKYVLQDITTQYAYAESAYMITDNSTNILFVDGKKQYDVEGVFIDECRNIFYQIDDQEYNQKVTNGDNWTSLTVTTEDKYYYISWIDDTYIYITTSIGNEKNVEKFIDELGY